MYKGSQGFTLMELMIVVAIVGILVAIAYPSYTEYNRKARRADGKAALIALQQAQAKFRGNCRYYAQTIHATDATNCGTTVATVLLNFPTTSDGGFYNIAITAPGDLNSAGTSYTATADPTGGQAGDTDCDPLTLTVNSNNPDGLMTPTACW